jgi:hypothetical protein
MATNKNFRVWGKRLLTPVICAGLCALAACSQTPEDYPSLAQINPMGTTLSKEEQAKTLKDLQQSQKTQLQAGDAAAQQR